MRDNIPNRNKRIVFMLSGAIDALIGAVILLIGFGFLPVDIADYGLPSWVVILVGAFMFIMGAWMAAYNYLRLEE
jgi:branched-subunit amino acid ABC-type transport system permease component